MRHAACCCAAGQERCARTCFHQRLPSTPWSRAKAKSMRELEVTQKVPQKLEAMNRMAWKMAAPL
jgi:hypothetical protein